MNRKNTVCDHAAISRRTLRLLERRSPDFLKRLLRSKIILCGSENHAINESQRVLNHQRFQLAVVSAAPERPLQKGIANLDFTFFRVEVVVSRTPYNSS